MTLYIQDYDTEEMLFQTEDCCIAPHKGESLILNGRWYNVIERSFSFKHLTTIDANSCSLFVKESNDG